jgi:hypothetical protein
MIGAGRDVRPQVMVARFKNAFPDYKVVWNNPRYELVTTNDSDPWCVISSDPEEIWQTLKEVPRA